MLAVIQCPNYAENSCLRDLLRKNSSLVSQIEKTFHIADGINGFNVKTASFDSGWFEANFFGKTKSQALHLNYNEDDCLSLSFNKISTVFVPSSDPRIFMFDGDTWYPFLKCFPFDDPEITIKQECVDTQAVDEAKNKILELRKKLLLQAQERTATIIAFAFYASVVVALVPVLFFLNRQTYRMCTSLISTAQSQLHGAQSSQNRSAQNSGRQVQGNPEGQAIPAANMYE